ncbi:Domain of uncharacterised function (DUF1905) [Nocardia otitidiscaviarum]|uniref:DUF1905 domain-containing protein n=1 Tax=Nocardia otitidiscaviarum TaxID=1823 RepID=A0A378YC86_9NOCA|nr:DUF1905 domain-containing protein [Nocardia otitidiscaviarum]MCP9622263.1 DUF1905 domain-containing protein [Nocardia otitidiscaviarum]QDP82814.1 DUF1905 domain-containing protein [Nocardia otitidiscaviarum]SUA74140.1 Domain of uncharacterised function (DUF1905) [Nocardia otitidiscaviarum]
MAHDHYTFTAELWEYDGPAAWYFLNVPEAIADEIEEMYGHRVGGFGSVRVEVVIGASRWATSLFPDKKRGTYLLPVKKPVRISEGLSAGDSARVEITVLV